MKDKTGSRDNIFRTLRAWLESKLELPSDAEVRHINRAWDYAQVDSDALWEREIDSDRLQAAIKLGREDPQSAFDEFLDLALTGSVIAMNQVGECYFWGRGVTKDEARGETWFKRSFEGGSQRALLNYGTSLYWRGDLKTAEIVFRRGVDQDFSPAFYWLACTLNRISDAPESRQEARRLFERATARGSPSAQWRLSRDMARGHYGVVEIPHGLLLLWNFSWEILAAWEKERKARGRTTAAGETLH